MNRWIKLLILMLVAVSLPLQGLAAVSMPACNMAKATMHGSTVMPSTDAHMRMDETASINGVVDASTSCAMTFKNGSTPISHKTCSDQQCSICYLSVVQLPEAGLLPMPNTLLIEYQDLINMPYQTFPTALFHPPKLISI